MALKVYSTGSKPAIPSLGQMSPSPIAPQNQLDLSGIAKTKVPTAYPSLSSFATGTPAAPSISVPNIATNTQTSTPAAPKISSQQPTASPYATLTAPLPSTGSVPAQSTTPTANAASTQKPTTPTLITTPSGAVVNSQTGEIVAPPPAKPQQETAPSPTPTPTPTVNRPTVPNISALERGVQNYMTPSAEEQATQEDINRLSEATRRGLYNTGQQPIAMDFITGQQKAIEDRSNNQLLTLEQRAARLQAKRLASLDASKFALERAEKAAGKAPIEVNGQLVEKQADGTYKSVFGAPKTEKLDTSTVEVGGRRLLIDNQTGNTIRDLGAASTGGADDGSKLLSVTEAQALGVPYGTTRASAYGRAPSGSPSAEESKARQFSAAAAQAISELNSVNYDPGIIESPLPNFAKSSERQQFERAARALVNAALRRESGATITDDEFKNKYKEIIDAAGDSTETKAKKKAARAQVLTSLQGATGMQTPTAPASQAYELNGVRYVQGADGSFYPQS